ncbi:hypothetical protein BCR33DRAFT_791644 [Rhizoclosmatium globosum]|uniref:Uncharacterized protein n=1 Tax=Rhizoclosmatium globosum TaxID=329046 RepID=A0A1Y2BDG3_9FUNG|nr:hypothetical protein BCR33DRAFT_791644 [Rhizoclosmatium globosum]|eukprot:ORY32746.1 hypothetical protein BCR33DRAFT_791644 [Rhizoclosmatium globosum]
MDSIPMDVSTKLTVVPVVSLLFVSPKKPASVQTPQNPLIKHTYSPASSTPLEASCACGTNNIPCGQGSTCENNYCMCTAPTPSSQITLWSPMAECSCPRSDSLDTCSTGRYCNAYGNCASKPACEDSTCISHECGTTACPNGGTPISQCFCQDSRASCYPGNTGLVSTALDENCRCGVNNIPCGKGAICKDDKCTCPSTSITNAITLWSPDAVCTCDGVSSLSCTSGHFCNPFGNCASKPNCVDDICLAPACGSNECGTHAGTYANPITDCFCTATNSICTLFNSVSSAGRCCTPQTCATGNWNSGSHPDGCGGTINCDNQDLPACAISEALNENCRCGVNNIQCGKGAICRDDKCLCPASSTTTALSLWTKDAQCSCDGGSFPSCSSGHYCNQFGNCASQANCGDDACVTPACGTNDCKIHFSDKGLPISDCFCTAPNNVCSLLETANGQCCAPKTCTSENWTSGNHDDECGNIINCDNQNLDACDASGTPLEAKCRCGKNNLECGSGAVCKNDMCLCPASSSTTALSLWTTDALCSCDGGSFPSCSSGHYCNQFGNCASKANCGDDSCVTPACGTNDCKVHFNDKNLPISDCFCTSPNSVCFLLGTDTGQCCTPKTCKSENWTSGNHNDGCGNIINCDNQALPVCDVSAESLKTECRCGVNNLHCGQGAICKDNQCMCPSNSITTALSLWSNDALCSCDGGTLLQCPSGHYCNQFGNCASKANCDDDACVTPACGTNDCKIHFNDKSLPISDCFCTAPNNVCFLLGTANGKKRPLPYLKLKDTLPGQCCAPKTCKSDNWTSGNHDDGCGNIINCDNQNLNPCDGILFD